tara:strand:- start:348 stop:650 length:303 start_codon:yes stop_codon:yes gene_type:complete
MKDIIKYCVTGAVATYLALSSAGCSSEFKERADFGRNPNNNVLENAIVDATQGISDLLVGDFTQKLDKGISQTSFSSFPPLGPSLGTRGMKWYSISPRKK